MPHVREQIRDAVAAALADLTLTEDRVFTSQFHELHDEELPGLRIFTENEGESENLTLNDPPLQLRPLELMIEAVDKTAEDIDNTLDDIAEDVEIAMMADVTLGGLVQGIIYVGTEKEVIEEGEQPVGVARLNYIVTYQVMGNAPGTAV